MAEKKHQTNETEYQIRVDGKPVYFERMFHHSLVDKFIKKCEEHPDCYVDIVQVSTNIIMCQASHRELERHFNGKVANNI